MASSLDGPRGASENEPCISQGRSQQNHQSHEKGVIARHASKGRFPQSRSVPEIVAGSLKGYLDAQNRRFYGERRLM